MKKLIIFVLILTVCFSVLVVGVNAEDSGVVNEEITEQPSDIAIYIEEHIVETLVALFTYLSLGIGLYIKERLSNRKTFTMFNNERVETNNTLTKVTDTTNLVLSEFRNSMNSMKEYLDRITTNGENINQFKEDIINKLDTFTTGFSEKMGNIVTNEIIIIECLKLIASNDENLVRKGVVELINKLSTKAV